MAAAEVALVCGCALGCFGSAWLLTDVAGGDGERAGRRHSRRPARRQGLAGLGERLGTAVGRLDPRRPAGGAGELVPTMLDIVTLGLSAGLSFDASLELYCERFENPLSSALARCLLRWRMGETSRARALREAGEELGEPSLADVAEVVEESLALGLPLASSLDRQARALRERHRSHVEEEIERLPVKMLIPLGTLIVPAMLLAILGPLLGFVVGVG